MNVERTTWIGSAIIAALTSPVLAAVFLTGAAMFTNPDAGADAIAMLLVWGAVIGVMWASPIALVFGALSSKYLQRFRSSSSGSLVARGAVLGAVVGAAYGAVLDLFAKTAFGEIVRFFPFVGFLVGAATGSAVSLNVLADRRLQHRLNVQR